MRDSTMGAYLTHQLVAAAQRLEHRPEGSDPLALLGEVGNWHQLLLQECRYHDALEGIRGMASSWEAQLGGEDLWAEESSIS